MTFLKDAAFFLVLSTAHWWLHWSFPMGGLAPNLLFAGALSYAVIGGPVRGIAWPFLFGLYADVLGAGLAGSWALIYTLIGYVVQVIKRHFDLDSPFSQSAAALVLSLLSLIAYQSAYLIVGGLSPLPLRAMLLEPLISALAVPLVFAAVRRACGRPRR
ncbi:MAG: rod shape-determining protein MreD [Elusimicrobiales bacterium]|nr:rod shape-determining protein MreD [Elusimicrobiales bacterium]